MRKIVIVILLVITSCNLAEKEERVLVQGKEDALLVIDVPKARCKKCQRIIEQGLQQEHGVQQSILNLNTKEVSIVYQPEKITPEALKISVNQLVEQIPCK